MKKTVDGSIDLTLRLTVDMAELAALPQENRLKLLGWISSAVNGAAEVSLQDLEALAEPKQITAPKRNDDRGRCKKCHHWYASKEHEECKRRRQPHIHEYVKPSYNGQTPVNLLRCSSCGDEKLEAAS